MPVSRSRYELLERRLARFTRMLHGIEKCDVLALHRTRVASRRLRELLPVLHLQGKVAGDLGRRLQKITQRLGKVRELDGLLLLIDTLKASGRYDQVSLDRVGSAIAEERAEARERLQAKRLLRALRRVSSKLGKLLDELEAADALAGRARAGGRALAWAVEARIHRRGDALKSAIRDAGAMYLPDRLHAVRIALKKFRYAMELGSEVSADPRMLAALRSLKRHQDLLGRWHDRHVLVDRVRQVQAALAPPPVGVWRDLDALVMAIEKDCRSLHARHVRGSAGLVDICDRLAARSPAAARRVG